MPPIKDAPSNFCPKTWQAGAVVGCVGLVVAWEGDPVVASTPVLIPVLITTGGFVVGDVSEIQKRIKLVKFKEYYTYKMYKYGNFSLRWTTNISQATFSW